MQLRSTRNVRYPAAPAQRALVIGRDDMPADEAMANTLTALSVSVTSVTWPGYAAMMVEPHEAVIAVQTLESIREWLRTAHAFAPARAQAAPPRESRRLEWIVDGVREAFGQHRVRAVRADRFVSERPAQHHADVAARRHGPVVPPEAPAAGRLEHHATGAGCAAGLGTIAHVALPFFEIAASTSIAAARMEFDALTAPAKGRVANGRNVTRTSSPGAKWKYSLSAA